MNARILRVCRVYGDNRCGPHNSLLVASVINQQPVTSLHIAKVLESNRISDAIPYGRFLPLQVSKRVRARLRLEQILHVRVLHYYSFTTLYPYGVYGKQTKKMRQTGPLGVGWERWIPLRSEEFKLL